jgi:hypothetical protein
MDMSYMFAAIENRSRHDIEKSANLVPRDSSL